MTTNNAVAKKIWRVYLGVNTPEAAMAKDAASEIERLEGLWLEEQAKCLDYEAEYNAAKHICTWTEDGDMWETTCGNAFSINDGTPKDNDMKFCCFCGKTLEEDRYEL